MKLHKLVLIGLVIIFTSSYTAPMESLACWGTGNYMLECCFVCCETEDDCDNYRNNPARGYNCRYNWYCLFNPVYCLLQVNCPDAGYGGCPLSAVLNNDEETIETLRRFRDEVLIKTPVGREYIRLYYQWSPAIVKAMEKDEEFRKEVKELIEELLPSIEKTLQ